MKQLLFAAVLATTSVLPAATVITFDEAGFTGGEFASTTFNGVTFSASGGGGLVAKQTGPNGTFGLLDDNAPRKELRADFIGGTNFVSVDLGDFDSDPDLLFLQVFNSANVSLGFASLLIDASFTGMQTLSLSAPNIAYAVFGARPPAINGSSVFADNLTFNQVPEPRTLLPIGVALALSLLVRGVRRCKSI